MCRFVMYLGPAVTLSTLVTEPNHSIIRQSDKAREREEPLNGDGLGVAWYLPVLQRRAAIFKGVSPAWSNQNLLHLAPVVKSECAVISRCSSDRRPPNTLYAHRDCQYSCDEQGEGRLVKTNVPAVLIASEPLTSDDTWQCVEPNHLLVVDARRQAQQRAIDIA